MKVNFIGCPCSGKTTTAAMTFSSLKETGLPVEFISEQARCYIAEKRFLQQKPFTEKLLLDNHDQTTIMERQLFIEEVISYSVGPNVVVISDSHPLNSLLYMSSDNRSSHAVKLLTQEAIKNNDLTFYCYPVNEPATSDPNRVHDRNESMLVDRQLPGVINTYAPTVWNSIIHLTGEPKYRFQEVTRLILQKMFDAKY